MCYHDLSNQEPEPEHEAGDGYAVLMIHKDLGDLILANPRDIVLPWMQGGYAFIK